MGTTPGWDEDWVKQAEMTGPSGHGRGDGSATAGEDGEGPQVADEGGDTETAGPVEELTAQVTGLTAQVAELTEMFRRRLANDRQREQMYDELYRQLEFARSGLIEQFIAPMARELLLVIDRIDALAADGGTDGAAEVEHLRSVAEELTEILARRGGRVVDAVGEKFDPRVHQAVGRAEVGDGAQVGTVVEVRRPGYALGEKLLRPAEVIVGHRPG